MTKRKLDLEILSKRLDLLELHLQELKKMEPEQLKQRLDKIEDMLFTNKGMLTSQEAADYMGISLSMLYKMTSTLEIPHYKPRGKMVYFDKLELEEWMRKNHYQSRVKDISPDSPELTQAYEAQNKEKQH